jgi:hypothetical protein
MISVAIFAEFCASLSFLQTCLAGASPLSRTMQHMIELLSTVGDFIDIVLLNY